jgi:hypothetical protein
MKLVCALAKARTSAFDGRSMSRRMRRATGSPIMGVLLSADVPDRFADSLSGNQATLS